MEDDRADRVRVRFRGDGGDALRIEPPGGERPQSSGSNDPNPTSAKPPGVLLETPGHVDHDDDRILGGTTWPGHIPTPPSTGTRA